MYTAMGARDFNRYKKALLFYERRTKQDRRKGGFSDVIDVPLPTRREMDQAEFKWQQTCWASRPSWTCLPAQPMSSVIR